MPEVWGRGLYFDPEQPELIADAVERLVRDARLRAAVAQHARDHAAKRRGGGGGARETWRFLRTIAESGR
jgi:hypothetical protein